MTIKARNIFAELFAYHPSDGLTPKENYITQAFAHILQRYPSLGRRWIAHVTGVKYDDLAKKIHVETQKHFPYPLQNHSYIDLTIRCRTREGRSIAILSEHKWDSPTDPSQLTRYRKILKTQVKADKKLLAFVGLWSEQRKAAMPFCHRAFLWEEVYSVLHQHVGPDQLAREFIAFLGEQRIGTPPFTKAILGAGGMPVHNIARDMMKQLSQRDWAGIPASWREKRNLPKAGLGERTGITFSSPKYDTRLFVGVQDYNAPTITIPHPASASVHLVFAIEVPKISVHLKGKAITLHLKTLRNAGIDVLGPHDLTLHLQKFIIRQPLTEIIEGHSASQDQADAIYAHLHVWLGDFFKTAGRRKAIQL